MDECCGTLGTAVNEAYFALFSAGAHVTKRCLTAEQLLPVHSMPKKSFRKKSAGLFREVFAPGDQIAA